MLSKYSPQQPLDCYRSKSVTVFGGCEKFASGDPEGVGSITASEEIIATVNKVLAFDPTSNFISRGFCEKLEQSRNHLLVRVFLDVVP